MKFTVTDVETESHYNRFDYLRTIVQAQFGPKDRSISISSDETEIFYLDEDGDWEPYSFDDMSDVLSISAKQASELQGKLNAAVEKSLEAVNTLVRINAQGLIDAIGTV